MLSLQSLSRVRNLGIIAHIDAGKTTVTERILFITGGIHREGEVHHGDTETDFLPLEREMGITISSAATSVMWSPTAGSRAGIAHHLNLIDTPGHVDFTIEVERSLRVLDGAVVVLDAGHGVESQSETVWRQADRYGVPRLVFVNKLDKLGASFASCLESLRERLGVVAVPIQIPIGEEAAHRGVVDLVGEKAIVFSDASKSGQFDTLPIPPELVVEARMARARMLEACADVDDTILAKLVGNREEDITPVEIEDALRRATLANKIVVVLCGSAAKHKGIPMLLDAICTYLPSPADLPPVAGLAPDGSEATRPSTSDAPLAAYAFKVMNIDRLGSVTFLRVYSGSVRSGESVLNATTGKRERLGRLVELHANKATETPAASAGDIVAAIGLRNTRTGDTLTDPGHPLVLGAMTVPEPVVEIAIEPCTSTDQERLSTALQRMGLEDPSLIIGTDAETGRTLLRGMGELHLLIAVENLRRDHRVEVTTGKPSVAYRETIARAARGEHRFVKQSGGPGQYGHVVLTIAPAARGRGFVFEDTSSASAIPKQFVPAVREGVRGALGRGIVAGHPMVDVEVHLVDGSFHPIDSRASSFEIAASMAFKKAAEAAEPFVLEPVMAVEIVVPSELLGEAVSHLHSLRGEVRDVSDRGNAKIVVAHVALRALFGHVNALRGKTQGRASATMQLSHYAKRASS